MSEADPAAAALARVYRDERAGVLATLIGTVGDFQLAEDAVQDAFAEALRVWRAEGVPRNPGAWITTAARRRAIDRLRRARSQADRARRLAESLPGGDDDLLEDGETALTDDRLRLIFTCCHPVLDPPARVALTLRAVGGMTTAEIARAFLVAEPAMGKRIVRAKRRLAAAQVPYRVPTDDELPDRLQGVLRVVYLIFNEGYAASAGPHLVREELCDEAIRLARLLAELLPAEPEVWGLLALVLLHDARRDARVDAAGRWIALPEQDRGRWSRDQVGEGVAALRRALGFRRPGAYQLQAAIASLQMRPSGDGDAAWHEIAALLAALSRLDPSPVVALNHAVAVGLADGPRSGLRLLEPLLAGGALVRYQPLYAAQADLLARAGDRPGAARAYDRAIELSANEVEQAELRRRLDGLTV